MAFMDTLNSISSEIIRSLARSKKLPELYMIPYSVLLIVKSAFPVIEFCVMSSTAGKEISFVTYLMVKSPVIFFPS